MSSETITRTAGSVCPFDCPDTCGLSVTIEDGRIKSVTGDKHHPVTQGAICNKVRQLPDRVHHPERLLYPMKRVGAKGSRSFERISWDEAYGLIKARIEDTVQTHGSEAILPYSFYGNMGVLNSEGMDRRFFHRLGASLLDRAICNSAGAEGYRYTMGGSIGIDPEDTVHTKLFIIWGCNLVSTNMHQTMLATEARKHGAQIIHIDVHRNRTSVWADRFIHVQPGTDGALALGMMHIIIRDGHVDADFVREHTVGYEELAAQAAEYTPERVSAITGVPVDELEELALLYGTSESAFIRIGNGLQHHDNGGMTVRNIACLPALTGHWQARGGGAMKGNSWYSRFNADLLERPDLLPDAKVRTINMNQLGDALLDTGEPVHMLFVYNSNPAIVTPDQNKVRAGLLRDDLFTVVHDLFLTDTCKYADLVLPATSHFENTDLYASYWHLYVQLHEPIIAPIGECKSNFTLFKELALLMCFEDDIFNVTEEQMIMEALDSAHNPLLEGITLQTLKERKYMKAGGGQLPPLSSRIPTPSGKIELYSEAMAKDGHSPVPVYNELLEPEDYPFWLTTGPNHSFINSTFANQDKLRKLEKQPSLHMHAADAANLGVTDGERVKVRNGRGEVVLTARVGELVKPGVLVTQGLWWEDEELGHQAINSLTPQRLADMGGGAVYFSNRVEVVKLTDNM